MAYVGTTNVPANNTSGLALYTIKETLKLAGWSVLSSGTGTAGSTAASDLITTGTGTSLGSFAVANAWVRIREPSGAGGREYVLQNGNANNSVSVIIKYSRATGFGTGGTATVAPTTGGGGDGVVWVGTGTDAAPVQATTWLPGAATGYYHAVASDVAINGVYGWWWYGYLAGGSTPRMIGTEAVSPGSTAATDGDPSVRYQDNLALVAAGSQTVQWWEAYGLPGAAYRTAGGFGIAFNGSYAAGVPIMPSFNGLDPYTGRVPMFASVFGKGSTMPKGYSTEAVYFGTVQNAQDTFNLSSASPKIAPYATSVGVGISQGLALPWVTSVVPLV
jgi:hypothetical protein